MTIFNVSPLTKIQLHDSISIEFKLDDIYMKVKITY